MAVVTDNSTLLEIEDAVVDELTLIYQDENIEADEDDVHEIVRPLLLYPEKFAKLIWESREKDDL